MSEHGSRHRAREVALQVLYALDLDRSCAVGDEAASEAFERVATNFEMPRSARGFAESLVREVALHRDALDARIAEHARNWRLSRMAAVDRNVLRIAVHELVHSDTPPAVVIDEAVELARRFGSESSPAFVNGIADAVARALAGERAASAGASERPAGPTSDERRAEPGGTR